MNENSQNEGNGTKFLEILADIDNSKAKEDTQVIIYPQNDMIYAI